MSNRRLSGRQIGVGIGLVSWDGFLLLGRNQSKNGWELAGGCQEGTETILATAERELKEETGLFGFDLQFAGYVDQAYTEWVSLVFGARTDQIPIENSPEPEKHDLWAWFSVSKGLDSLPRLTTGAQHAIPLILKHFHLDRPRKLVLSRSRRPTPGNNPSWG
jgi:8-oxo-dGTP pyrophosphatase MutT (NUDIX family)